MESLELTNDNNNIPETRNKENITRIKVEKMEMDTDSEIADESLLSSSGMSEDGVQNTRSRSVELSLSDAESAADVSEKTLIKSESNAQGRKTESEVPSPRIKDEEVMKDSGTDDSNLGPVKKSEDATSNSSPLIDDDEPETAEIRKVESSLKEDAEQQTAGIRNLEEEEDEEEDEEDAVVISASWVEPFYDDLDQIDLTDKDTAITELKSLVTKLQSLVKMKDETMKFIEHQTKAEVRKMTSEMQTLRETLMDEQKKVTSLEEDLKKKEDIIKKFKSSFERIGKAVTLEKDTNHSSDETLRSTLSLVKDILPGNQNAHQQMPRMPQWAPPMAHGKPPFNLPAYRPFLPQNPSQGSLTPAANRTMHPNPNHTSPTMAASGSMPMNLSAVPKGMRPPYFGNSQNVHGPPLVNLTPAHTKNHNGQNVKNFGDAVSLCIQKHMDGLRPIQPMPPNYVPPTNYVPNGAKPTLPAKENPPKKRSRRKNPNPVSIKQAKVEYYKEFHAPSMFLLDVTEPGDVAEEDEVEAERLEAERLEAERLEAERLKEEHKVEAALATVNKLREREGLSPKQAYELELEDSEKLVIVNPEPCSSPKTPNGFPPFIKQEPLSPPQLLPFNLDDSPFMNTNPDQKDPKIVGVSSLAAAVERIRKSLKSESPELSPSDKLKRRDSFDSTPTSSPAGGFSEGSEFETYANKPRHKCTFCQPSTSFSYCNDLLMHLYNQHKELDCPSIQHYVLDTIPVMREQLTFDDEQFNLMAINNDINNTKNYICKICLRNLPSRYMFVLHLCTHTGERPYKCEFCPQRFVDGVTLWQHKKEHREAHPEIFTPKLEASPGEKPFKCEECGKGFLHQGSLSNHRKLHIGWKPYRCEGCGKEFTRNASLMIHMRSHTKETPFKCQICGKGFTQSCNLNTHLRIHRGEKPFHCPVCMKNFSRKFVLQKHRCLPGATPPASTPPPLTDAPLVMATSPASTPPLTDAPFVIAGPPLAVTPPLMPAPVQT